MNIHNFGKASAAKRGLALCHDCHTITPIEQQNCHHCGKGLCLRKSDGVQKCLAWLLTAILFYIPANLYPIMATSVLGSQTESTIIGGVLLFIDLGSYSIALVIFLASVAIPLAKIGILGLLCLASNGSVRLAPDDLTKLYRIVEFIGKWSMVDVFVVALLVALVQAGNLMSIEPGIAIMAFSFMVICTMLAAEALDLRIIWDKATQ